MRLIVAALLTFACLTAWATDLNLVAVMGNKAMVEVNGSKPKLLSPGQSINGVKLISASGSAAVFDINGQKKTLTMDNRSYKSGGNGGGSGQKIFLFAEPNGHFYANISINGITVRGMIDTGATALALPKGFASSAGIDLSHGTRTYSRTANGVAPITVTSVNTVKFADVVLHNVQASVHEGNGLGVPLIGMSILSRFTMERDGDRLILTKRY
ncbi:aspartyl protease family protein [Formivibrio citricus]|uniref:Aspartyl protease family protein n=1 Tax=Formivibrio citricus TaxID=83765 RepID=A0A1I4X231_9NEIS|nr:TIGR02281 family clan AA aspartic protease [Formivibrio citricus]SFN19430.1 aspartyl protease family protein [Formivibrio citricus]